jgi:hypothetical protein
MNRIQSAPRPDRFDLEAAAHEHRTEVVDDLVHDAAEWVGSHVRDVAHRLEDLVTHLHGTAH